MKIFAVVDDRGGMTFNRRRQSQDIELREYILAMVADGKLMMNSYSFKQFEDGDVSNITVDDDFLAVAEDEFCFVESPPIAPYLGKIDVIYLCKWNRDYPSDAKFDIDLSDGWTLNSTVDIKGKSHKKITIEEWQKLT